MPLSVFILTFTFYLSKLAPEIYWLDSSEFAAASFQLGIAHPPGHPLALLVGKACALFPFGSIAFRVGVASALASAFAAAQTAQLGALLSARIRNRDRAESFDSWLGASAGILFGLSYATTLSAVRPEVYALSTALVVTAALELVRSERAPARLGIAALCAGLALANHHLLAFTFLIPAAIYSLWRRKVALPLAGVALGLMIYGYLPLRAAHHPLLNWGAPTTWARLVWTISAQAFQKSVGHRSTGALPEVAFALAAELKLAALFALLGIYLAIRTRALRAVGITLALSAILDAATRALVGFDPSMPDDFGYLEAAIAILSALACIFPAALLDMVGRAKRRYGAAVTLFAAACANFSVDLSKNDDARRVFSTWLDAAPPRATVITSYFQTIFGLAYLRAVEGARPDTTLIHRHFLTYPGYREEVLWRNPELLPLLGDQDVAQLPDGPLLLEYDFDLPDQMVFASRAIAVPPEPQPVEPSMRSRADPQTHRFGGWEAYMSAERACRLHDPDTGNYLLSARLFFGDAPELSALAARCGGFPELRLPDTK